jgi:hypothetical protein
VDILHFFSVVKCPSRAVPNCRDLKNAQDKLRARHRRYWVRYRNFTEFISRYDNEWPTEPCYISKLSLESKQLFKPNFKLYWIYQGCGLALKSCCNNRWSVAEGPFSRQHNRLPWLWKVNRTWRPPRLSRRQGKSPPQVAFLQEHCRLKRSSK